MAALGPRTSIPANDPCKVIERVSPTRLLGGFCQTGELRQRILWRSIDALTVLSGTGAIELRIESVGITAVPSRHNLAGYTSDHRVRRELFVLSNDGMARHN